MRRDPWRADERVGIGDVSEALYELYDSSADGPAPLQ